MALSLSALACLYQRTVDYVLQVSFTDASVCVCVYICVYVFLCIYVYIETFWTWCVMMCDVH